MNKKEALERIAALEKETAELKKIINAPEKPTAREWLINFLNENAKKWRVEMGEGRQVWYLGDQWIFDLYWENKHMQCHYRVWEIFKCEYRMGYADIQQLIKEVVIEPFNFLGFTPVLCDY